jgi:hypothetical protein
LNSVVLDEFRPAFGCAAPKRWSKYTTVNLNWPTNVGVQILKCLSNFSNELKGVLNGPQEQSAFTDEERRCSFDSLLRICDSHISEL